MERTQFPGGTAHLVPAAVILATECELLPMLSRRCRNQRERCVNDPSDLSANAGVPPRFLLAPAPLVASQSPRAWGVSEALASVVKSGSRRVTGAE